MDQLWGVLGRACVDGSFAAELKKTVVEKQEGGYSVPEDEVANLDGLHKLLAKEGFRASRWERGELNRVFFWLKVGKGAQALKSLAEIWQKLQGIQALPSNPAELWRLLGLCSVDKEVAGRYFAAPDQIDREMHEPRFVLGAEEVKVLKEFFKVGVAEQWLGVVHRESWIPPTGAEQAALYRALAAKLNQLAAKVEGEKQPMVQCSPGYDAQPRILLSYRHLPSPIVERLASDLNLASIFVSPRSVASRRRSQGGRARRKVSKTG